MAERLGLALLATLVLAGMVAASALDPGVGAGRGAADQVATTSPAPVPSPTPAPTATAAPAGQPADWVVTGAAGTALWTEADGVVDEVAAPGLAWPILSEEAGGYRVATHCDREGWVDGEDVLRPVVQRGDGVAGAVVVVDAGHGGDDDGALGPTGLTEAESNLAVATRLQALLSRANDVDDETGAVTPGDQWPSLAGVLMTRDVTDGFGGDQRTSLAFRGRLGRVVEADALVSIHHNAGPTRTFDDPPVEVLFSVDDDASSRLAGLVLEELRRSLDPLADDWQGSTGRGAIGRADPDGTDYYTVLEEADVPAVITEGLYLTDPASEDLARTDAFRQAYAEGLYRAMVRFLGSRDVGAEVSEPAVFEPAGETSTYDYSDCTLAAPVPPVAPSGSPESGSPQSGG